MTPFSALSALPQTEFVAALDGIYEHSPWVAEEAWHARPFADLDALHAAMAQAVAEAGPALQAALLWVHPELAARAVVLTDLSRSEQGGAGLDRCSPGELSELTRLNKAYRERFGMPFIIAVRGLTPADIVSAMTQRLQSSLEDEVGESLRQVDRISLLRLRDRFAST